MGKSSFVLGTVTAGLLANVLAFAQRAPSDLPRVGLGATPELIYSVNPNDPWNKIFYFLFSRKLTVRLSSDFAEGAPFIDRSGRKVSTRVFERNETGDRAIDPMYPTFAVGFGSMLALSDSAYPAFTQALRAALAEPWKTAFVALDNYVLTTRLAPYKESRLLVVPHIASSTTHHRNELGHGPPAFSDSRTQ